jgi:hypothetical protein
VTSERLAEDKINGTDPLFHQPAVDKMAVVQNKEPSVAVTYK